MAPTPRRPSSPTAVAEIRDRLAEADGMQTLLEDALAQRLIETPGLDLVRDTSNVMRDHPGHVLDGWQLPAD